MTNDKSENQNEWLVRLKACGEWFAATKQRIIGIGLLLAFVAVAVSGLAAVWKCVPAVAEFLAPAECGPDLATELGKILGGGLGILGLLWQIYVSNRRATAMEKTVNLTEKGNIAERFKTAIEQLGNNSATIRLGGIYALHHIAATTKGHAETENYRERVFEILCAYVRETTTAKQYRPREDPAGRIVQEYKPSSEIRILVDLHEQEKARVTPTVEIQTILDLLFVKGASVYAGLRADLRDANLEGADLPKAQLPNAMLNGVVLAHSVLTEANLHNAKLSSADLQQAWMEYADLRNASIWYADLRGVYAPGVNLEDADLHEADLHFTGIVESNLQNTILRGANLCGATLYAAANLTAMQLRSVASLHITQLPVHLEKENEEMKQQGYGFFAEGSVEEFYRQRNRNKKRRFEAI